jgi:hypothetical protein
LHTKSDAQIEPLSLMSAPPPTAAAVDPEASTSGPSASSVKELKDELTRLGVDSAGCMYKQELVDLVMSHQHAAPSAPGGGREGGQAAG